MKVKELIEKLQTMPQDLEVGVYCEEDECDSRAMEVEIVHKLDEDDKYCYQAKEYYCQGDSIMVASGYKEWVIIKGY